MSKLTIKQVEKQLKEKMPHWQKSPILFIKDFWQLTPQPIKPEYKKALQILIDQHELQSIKASWFQPFERGIHITWQQYLILLSVEAAVNDKSLKRLSIASAHGIGKTCSMSWIIIWFLFCFYLSQIAVTAPTSKQLNDILWKELSIWINRMPKSASELFEWTQHYIRHTANPNEWFASAKTAKKDSTEALAGVHGQNVMVLADEASGVPEEVFNTMEGSLTEKNILVLLISNPTRISGYFWETHKKPEVAKKWQNLQFDNLSSPVVKEGYAQDIIDRHGKNSDEYRIRVLGEFPEEDSVDDKGYTNLLSVNLIKEIDPPQYQINKEYWIGQPIMGIDPAGEGRDETVWVVRDQFKAHIVLREKISTDKTIAQRTRTLATLHGVEPYNIWIDSFGIGSNTAAEIAKGWFKINALNVGDACISLSARNIYLNRKAENYMRFKKAISQGFELTRNKSWRDDIPAIKYRRNEKGRIQIMPKREAKKLVGKSPDALEALMLTFSKEYANEEIVTLTRGQRSLNQQGKTIDEILKSSQENQQNNQLNINRPNNIYSAI
ncbi:MAG: hypothetical protein U9R21_05705 [Candidatus Thermoplasmatota archaeon]|nr:hypothetical protein [Candidatus Thermoplasmatota archaeon]